MGDRPNAPRAASPLALVGQLAPSFELECTDPLDPTHQRVKLEDYAGRWLVLVFYARDFSFVCPAELTAFSARIGDFARRRCQLLGISVDPVSLHELWLATAQNQGGLGPLRYPLASDPGGQMARAYGTYHEEQRIAGRGLFIIDPDGVLQYQLVHSLQVGRDPDEALRMLDALQAGGLCPPKWTRGDGTIDPARALGPGRIFGHYRIDEKLGQGAFASVFRARDLWLEREVALKVLHPGQKADRKGVLAEARAAAALNHPNICTVYAVEEQAGLPVIAMEYLTGTLLSALVQTQRLSEDEIRWLARQIAHAMAQSHAQGVAHGDLKPGNIMITENGTVKVLDFGVAQRTLIAGAETFTPPTMANLAAGARAALTQEPDPQQSMLRGTPAYMAPEQARGGAPSPAADVFTFGLLLFEMATGQRAVRYRDMAAAIQQVQRPDLYRIAHAVPEPFRRLVASTLQPQAEQRPSMARIVRHLDAA